LQFWEELKEIHSLASAKEGVSVAGNRHLEVAMSVDGLWLLKKEPKQQFQQILATAAIEDSTTYKGTFELEIPRKEFFNSQAC
jgi:hypothetical protein